MGGEREKGSLDCLTGCSLFCSWCWVRAFRRVVMVEELEVVLVAVVMVS